MDDIVRLAEKITEAPRRGLVLILTADSARQSKTSFIAGLILKGPLFVISGDEWLPAYELPRIIRRQTTAVKEIMNQLYTVRASSCYRLFDSLASLPSKGEPVLVMELLHTFYDTDIPLRTRLFRLRECCRELARLAIHRPVIVMTRAGEGEDYEKFLPAICPIADRLLTLAPEFEPVHQPVLF
ncbi:MAG TPA: hypothetical protein VK900_08520 [Anaerolineales bacterium]|nr:hypothetical protein [Anaerolineales bacterium]